MADHTPSATESVTQWFLRLLAAVALAVGIFGAAYNAHDGMIFGTFAWLVLGGGIAALSLTGARS